MDFSNRDPKPISDERAVEAAQLSQPPQAESPQVSLAYFEPHKLVDLARHGRLYLLADGAGGAAAGHLASQYAVKKILHHYYAADTADPKTRLQQAIQQANADIFERNCQHPQRRPMAATLIAALVQNNKLLVANVGDSRVYVAWDQDIEPLIQTDAPAEESKKSAALSPPIPQPAASPFPPVEQPPPKETAPAAEQAKPAGAEKRPEAAVTPPPDSLQQRLPQSLGLQQEVKIDFLSRRLFPGDTVILCSGGLADYLTDTEIARALSRHPPDEAIRRLLALAAERGNRDDVAISTTRVLSSPVALRPPTPAPLPAAPNWRDWDTAPKPATAPTRPSATPAAASSPTARLIPTPQTRPPSTDRLPDFALERPALPWKGCLMAAGVALVICAILLFAGSSLIPPNILAAVPFLNRVESVAEGNAEPEMVDLPPTEAADSAGQPEPTAPPAATLVAENNSPVPDTTFDSPVFNSPVNTPAASSSEQDTLPAATPTPAATATPSPTPLPTITVPADCENKGRFRRDVTIPDGTQLAPAASFEKVWLVQNAGTCPWGPGYTARHIEGEMTGADNVVPLVEVVSPNSEGEVRVPMIAPPASGSYRTTWQLFDLNGEPFGPELYMEIEVTASAPAAIDPADVSTLYNFIENFDQATWTAGGVIYTPQATEVTENIQLPPGQGVVAIGPALLRGNQNSNGNVLLTYPDRQTGFIEGVYPVDAPLQPTDTIVATLGFIKLPILPDDGVTFEIAFTPAGGAEQVIFSQTVQYQDSPVSVVQPLTGVTPGQNGVFTLRARGGNSLSQDWATWIEARLVRP